MRNMLLEYFKMSGGILSGTDGKGRKVIYIDPEVSESTYDLKDEIKTKFGATWITKLKTWGWFVNGNPSDLIKNRVKPCLEFLSQNEKMPYTELNSVSDRNIDKELQDVIQALDKAIEYVRQTTNVDEEFSQRLEDLRSRLTDIFTGVDSEGSNNVADFVMNLIHFRNEQKKRNLYQYESMINLISIFYYTTLAGKSDEVRPKGQWLKMGYTINDNAVKIPLCGKRSAKSRPFTKKEREEYITWYLKNIAQVNSVDELEPSAKYDLFDRRLKRGKPLTDKKTKYGFIGYSRSDVTATENSEKDVEEPDDNWWWDKIDADEKDNILVEALTKFVQSEECGSLTVRIVDDLGKARGVASSDGVISLINDNNIKFPTFVHELTHQLKHMSFASIKNANLKRFHHRNSSRDVREQEAELCAAFIIEKYGYSIKNHINYMHASWGLNAKNINSVLDSIAEVANFIEQGIEKYLPKDFNNEKQTKYGTRN